MMKCKICGLKSETDVRYANAYLPDYIGFVFAGKKRNITDDMALCLKQLLNPNIPAVGVFVNEPQEHIKALCDKHIIDIVQLHGDETPEYILELQEKIPNQLIKAVRVKEIGDVIKAAAYPVDFLLFDAFTENEYGGSGTTFDLLVLEKTFQEIPFHKNYFLAGGIHMGNINAILSACRKLKYQPFGLDMSSGVETEGKKDGTKIKEIITIIKERNSNEQY